ncbi:MAG: LysM peptidoglycan-binding domain-containing protein [Roseburia sp.]|nr:LysM peptidoglycan-binding domain-containing protein [Roseburia sp.]
MRDQIRNAKRRQRQLEVRRNILFLTLTMVLIILVSVFVISFSSEASDRDRSVSHKYYTSIRIEQGDTLWSIANEYMDSEHYRNASEYVNEIKAMNSLTSDRIIAGNYLIVPYYSTEYVYAKH